MHMTCRNCKFEFCWLCLGDYKKHSKETGKYICQTVEDVNKAGRGGETLDLTEAYIFERE